MVSMWLLWLAKKKRRRSSGFEPAQRGVAPTSARTDPIRRYESHTSVSPELRCYGERAGSARHDRTGSDNECGRNQRVLGARQQPFCRADDAGRGENGHALLLGHWPAEVLGKAKRASKHADIGSQGGGERAEPAERRPANGVAQSDDKKRI